MEKIATFQLNIFQGKYLDEILTKITKEKYDLLHFQEVVGGKLSLGGNYVYPFKKHKNQVKNIRGNEKIAGLDIFEEIIKNTSYKGMIAKEMEFTHDEHSYFANATFYNNTKLQLVDSKILFLHEKTYHTSLDFDARRVGRTALAMLFETGESNQFWSINTHFAWGPTPEDKPYKISQAKKLYEFISKLDKPFILTGDFNVTPNTKTASMFDRLGINHVKQAELKNTLNEKIHPAQHLFPPGLAVDYIFTSKKLKTSDFMIIKEPIMSDHYGLSIKTLLD